MKNNDPILLWPGAEADASFREKMYANYQDSITILQDQWGQADLDQRTYLGDPDVWGVLFPSGFNLRRKLFSFNITASTIQMISGHQRRNRKATICIPVLPVGQQTADQLTKCLYHVHKQNGYSVYSDAFEQGALVQGFGLISVFPDFASDPVSPDIKLRYIDMKSVMIDPYFRQKDMSDCRFVWFRQYFDKEEAKVLYPEHAEEIENTPNSNNSSSDDKFFYMPENINLSTRNYMAFDEYWYLSTRQAVYAVDTESEETMELEGDEEDIRIIMMQFGERLKIVKKPKQTVRRTILINGRVLVDEERPYGMDTYPFVGTYGHFNPDTPYFRYKFKGVVRDLRDAQYLFNRRKVADLDIIESQQQGIKVKKGALVTPDDAMNTGQGRVLVIDKAFDMNDVQNMDIVPPSPVLLQVEEMLKGVHREISGVNEELLGSAVDDKAGVLSMLRQGAGLTTLQKLFDQLDDTQSLVGDVIIQMIQKFWSFGKIRSVLGEEPTAEFQNKAFFKYTAKVVQGALTETQQQLELAQLFELQQRFGEVFPADEIIECMTIQNKDRIIDKMAKAQEQQQQQQQQMAEMQMQQMQVENETKLAYSESQRGLAAERVAKIQTDKAVAVDKLKRADQEDTASLLNLVKTLSELQEMDLSNLERTINLLKNVEKDITSDIPSGIGNSVPPQYQPQGQNVVDQMQPI